MSKGRRYLYHPEYDPDGRIFDSPDLTEMAAQGWFDSPAKFGHSVWGDDETTMKSVEKTRQLYESGFAKRIDDPSIPSASETEQVKEAMRKMAELERRNKELQEEMGKLQSERDAQYKLLKEEEDDLEADYERTANFSSKGQPLSIGELIEKAVKLLTKGNPAHWTADGKPDVHVLRKHKGLEQLSAAQRDEHWDKMTAIEKGPDGPEVLKEPEDASDF